MQVNLPPWFCLLTPCEFLLRGCEHLCEQAKFYWRMYITFECVFFFEMKSRIQSGTTFRKLIHLETMLLWNTRCDNHITRLVWKMKYLTKRSFNWLLPPLTYSSIYVSLLQPFRCSLVTNSRTLTFLLLPLSQIENIFPSEHFSLSGTRRNHMDRVLTIKEDALARNCACLLKIDSQARHCGLRR